MKNVISEYTGAAVSLLGSICFFAVMSQFFLHENGLFAILITVVAQGGA